VAERGDGRDEGERGGDDDVGLRFPLSTDWVPTNPDTVRDVMHHTAYASLRAGMWRAFLTDIIGRIAIGKYVHIYHCSFSFSFPFSWFGILFLVI